MQLRTLVSIAFAVSAAACSSEAPPAPTGSAGALTTDGGTAPAPSAAGTTTAPPAAAAGACKAESADPCEVCVTQKCCTQIQAYEADPQAEAFAKCAVACEQATSEAQWKTCFAQCTSKHPQTAAKDDAIGQCQMSQCAAQCPQGGSN